MPVGCMCYETVNREEANTNEFVVVWNHVKRKRKSLGSLNFKVSHAKSEILIGVEKQHTPKKYMPA